MFFQHIVVRIVNYTCHTVYSVTVILSMNFSKQHNCSASLKLLHDCVATGGTGGKFGELVLKCNWKIIQMLSKRSNDLDVEVILKDVHHFLRVSTTVE